MKINQDSLVIYHLIYNYLHYFTNQDCLIKTKTV